MLFHILIEHKNIETSDRVKGLMEWIKGFFGDLGITNFMRPTVGAL